MRLILCLDKILKGMEGEGRGGKEREGKGWDGMGDWCVFLSIISNVGRICFV